MQEQEYMTMTYDELSKLFKELYKCKYISRCKFAQNIMKKYHISITTIQRWKRQGFTETLLHAFGYCKVCNTFFKKHQSHQVLCGAKKCELKHNALMTKMRGDNIGRVKPISQIAIIKRNALRKVSSKRATKSYAIYSQKEINIVLNSKLKHFDLALSLGRSISSVEGVIGRFNKRKEECNV